MILLGLQPFLCYNLIMSVLTAVGILLLSMLVLAVLQLVPGIFLLFSHFTRGKYSRVHANDLNIFFIIGVETAMVLVFLSLYAILCCSPAVTFIIDSDIFIWVMAGISLALSLISFIFYFRSGRGTELFISRRMAKGIKHKITITKTRSDAFVLGLVSIVPELIFTLPLILLSAIEIMRLNINCPERACLIILFAVAAIFPLLLIHGFSANGHTLAEFTRFRFKNKPFFRFWLSFSYFLIAILIILGVLL